MKKTKAFLGTDQKRLYKASDLGSCRKNRSWFSTQIRNSILEQTGPTLSGLYSLNFHGHPRRQILFVLTVLADIDKHKGRNNPRQGTAPRKGKFGEKPRNAEGSGKPTIE